MSEMKKQWPPEYTVRRSKKAQRVSLRVSDAKGLELVLPERGKSPDIPSILEAHRNWITGRLARRERRLARRDELQRGNPFAPPAGFWLHGGQTRIDLDIGKPVGGAALHEIFLHSLGRGAAVWPVKEAPERELHALLAKYIRAYARVYLSARLADIARESDLSYGALRFGAQKSRWGSYACDGTIRLNCKLVFLPEELSGNVMLHELCHSVHLNHSSAFWKLMQEKDAEAIKKNLYLREAEIWIPSWFN